MARLVVDRKTNPEIAAELFLSQKTVETDLGNIFHKVGVTSRVEVARLVEREERGDDSNQKMMFAEGPLVESRAKGRGSDPMEPGLRRK